MGNFFKAIGAGLVTGAIGFTIGGPIGAAAGFGIGAFGAAKGMQGKSGAVGGALIGGIAGFTIGGPIGALAGGLIGGIGGKAISSMFKPKRRPPRRAPYYPPMFYGGYGMPGMGMGMGMSMGMGMPMMGGMQMSMGMFGGYGIAMAGGMYGSIGMQGMSMWGMHQPVRGGQLSQKAPGKPISYRTSGGYNVTINGHTVTITDPSGKNTVKHWGDPHEKVNGKTIKDWEGKTRTLVLGDGTKITMGADGPHGVIHNTSIYDGGQAIHINNDKNQITNVSFNPYQSMMQEAYQPDGETSYVGYNCKGDFIYKNLYTQNPDLSIRNNYRLLAKSHRSFWLGKHTHDYYDDPRLFWT